MDPATEIVLALASLVGALIVARWWHPGAMVDRVDKCLRYSWTPIAAGAITSLTMAWIWSSLRQQAVITDGISYLTQARIFSTFHLFAGARPLPEFFEQPHMFVTPKFLSKYPPGHSLLLVPGVWLGLPALGPIVLAGVTGALTFGLARRISNGWIATTTWLMWVTAAGVDWSSTTYLSQTTTSALWLIGWYSLLRWWENERRGWLLLLACCIGWGALTHPFTWVLFSLPVGWVVLVHTARRGCWKDLGFSLIVGLAFIALLMTWSERTVGHGLTLPWSVYAQMYSPWDKIGFGADSTPALRTLPPNMASGAAAFLHYHASYTPVTLPAQLMHRFTRIVGDVWGDWRVVFVPIALLGFVALPLEFSFGLMSGVIVIGGYLLYAHRPQWTMYYLELYPLFAFAMALGIWRVICLTLDRTSAIQETLRRLASQRAAAGILLLNLALLPEYLSSIAAARKNHSRLVAEVQRFRARVASLPDEQIIVFVKYDPLHEQPWSLVFNEPDLTHARAWQVYDRGSDDIRLIRIASGRTPYLFDQKNDKFIRIDTTLLQDKRSSTASQPCENQEAEDPVRPCAPVIGIRPQPPPYVVRARAAR